MVVEAFSREARISSSTTLPFSDTKALSKNRKLGTQVPWEKGPENRIKKRYITALHLDMHGIRKLHLRTRNYYGYTLSLYIRSNSKKKKKLLSEDYHQHARHQNQDKMVHGTASLGNSYEIKSLPKQYCCWLICFPHRYETVTVLALHSQTLLATCTYPTSSNMSAVSKNISFRNILRKHRCMQLFVLTAVSIQVMYGNSFHTPRTNKRSSRLIRTPFHTVAQFRPSHEKKRQH